MSHDVIPIPACSAPAPLLPGVTIVLDRLPQIMEMVCDPACPEFNAATPWREGEEVYASDGCMTLRCPTAALSARVLREIPSWDATRPKDLAGTLQKLGPFVNDSRPIPSVPFEPPKCPTCDGRGRAGVVVGNHEPCGTCKGTGRRSRSGESVHLGGGFYLDRWYVALLNLHAASVFPPMHAKGINLGDHRFAVAAIQFVIRATERHRISGYVTTWFPPEAMHELNRLPSGSRPRVVEPVPNRPLALRETPDGLAETWPEDRKLSRTVRGKPPVPDESVTAHFHRGGSR